ncbi:hypothetical protein AK812_SmicGene33449 [Symbiodinium microadriaticum]|uniref:Uncharacterized protein n=1 Tax=Symbiodinium microadriaticum TaxID=2951 RepID=A0A1Q9CRK5_SYMMI|nr:hypothetical protein AK812_SmicGene33449 [Symbiodinium microadriaticum]
MGDCHAVELAQQSHFEVLRTLAGCLIRTEVVAFRQPFPPGGFLEFLCIDDHVSVQILSRAAALRGDPARDTRVFGQSHIAYEAVGLHPHPKKCQRNLQQATLLGADIDGVEGFVSAPRERTLLLMLCTAEIARRGTCTPKLLNVLLGCWIHVLTYRRPALCILDQCFKDAARLPSDVVTRLSQRTRNELLLVAIMGPLLQTDLRTGWCPDVFCMDASPTGAGLCSAPVPENAVAELHRYSEQRGFYTKLEAPSSAALREMGFYTEPVYLDAESPAPPLELPLPRLLLQQPRQAFPFARTVRREEVRAFLLGYPAALTRQLAAGSLAAKARAPEVLRYRFRKSGHINILEARMFKTFQKYLTRRAPDCRSLSLLDSRSSSPALIRVLQGTLPYTLGGGLYNGTLHVYSAQNRSDGPSRGKPVDPPTKEVPLWLTQLCQGQTHRFDLTVASSAAPKLAARWFRLLLLLGGDIEVNPGFPRYLFVYAITAIQDVFPAFRQLMTPAWQIDKKWQYAEPGECRPVISVPIVQAVTSIGLVWNWPRFVGVVLIGFLCMLHPSEWARQKTVEFYLQEVQRKAKLTLVIFFYP